MLAFMICGHGQFAVGLESALTMIAGDIPNVTTVNFTGDIAGLQRTLKQYATAVQQESAKNELIIFTDITGGTPWNQALRLALTSKKIGVVAGTNLPLLLGSVLQQHETKDAFFNWLRTQQLPFPTSEALLTQEKADEDE